MRPPEDYINAPLPRFEPRPQCQPRPTALMAPNGSAAIHRARHTNKTAVAKVCSGIFPSIFTPFWRN
jgi:hypothetical protein